MFTNGHVTDARFVDSSKESLLFWNNEKKSLELDSQAYRSINIIMEDHHDH